METLSHKLFRTSDIQKYKNQHHLIRVVLILSHKRERRVVSGKIPKCLLLMLMLSSRDSRDKKERNEFQETLLTSSNRCIVCDFDHFLVSRTKSTKLKIYPMCEKKNCEKWGEGVRTGLIRSV